MLNLLEEKALIARCVAFDDRRAFARLVDAYNPELRRFLRNLTGDADMADDLAQETFIKAYTGLRSFQGLARFRTWLFRIAYREFYSEMRSRHPMVDMENIPETSSTDAAEHTDNSHDIEAALKVLPPVERTLVLLFYMEDRPLKDIVAITGLPSGTVKSYLSRARGRLGAYFAREEERASVVLQS